uniref:Uncharacterized protein n=1 Tax=Rhizoctonia solani TaxID=456999 RepID=N0A369_9AGAM|nr:hypothetical protein RSOL_m00760 [Rhizoctonia solani]AGK45403.1 hypothetical protein RSOL_m00760 [Rhizoctonia solani]
MSREALSYSLKSSQNLGFLTTKFFAKIDRFSLNCPVQAWSLYSSPTRVGLVRPTRVEENFSKNKPIEI